MTCLIDLDGTVLNFWERYYSIFNDSFNLLSKSEYILMRREGLSEKMVLNLLGIMDIEKYLENRMKIIESEYYLSFDKLFDTKKLKQFDYRILITYRKNRINLINQLKKLNILEFFTKIITPENSLSAKKFKFKIIKKYKEKDCVMIGDTETDILSAKENGVYSIGVLSGMTSLIYMQNINPDKIIDNINEL